MFKILRDLDVLLFARVPMNLVCLMPLYRRICNNYTVLCAIKPVSGYSKKDFKKVSDDLTFIPAWMARFLRSKLYISSDLYLLSRKISKVSIYTFHGVSFKGRSYSDKVLMFDRLFIVGPYMMQKFVEKGILREDDHRALKVGMPKLDSLVNGAWDKESARKFIGLKKIYPFIALYAPTWGVASSVYNYGDLVIDVVVNLGGAIIVKLHDHSWRDPRCRLMIERWEKIPNVYIYRDFDINPAMVASDLLISDMSSVANEYTLLDRPIIYLFVPSFERRYRDTVDRSMLFKGGILVAKPNRKLIEKAIVESLLSPETYSADRRELSSLLFYNPGKATDVAVKYLMEFLS